MHKLYTVGYLATTLPALSNAVQTLNAVLIDVRYSPHSRLPQWRKANLEKMLGMRYIHSRDLGNRNYQGGGPIELVDAAAGANLVAGWLERQPVILMCACREVEHCHRLAAAEEIAARTGCAVEHLDRDGIRAHGQARLL